MGIYISVLTVSLCLAPDQRQLAYRGKARFPWVYENKPNFSIKYSRDDCITIVTEVIIYIVWRSREKAVEAETWSFLSRDCIAICCLRIVISSYFDPERASRVCSLAVKFSVSIMIWVRMSPKSSLGE